MRGTRIAAAALALGLAGGLAACAASPETSYVDASGETVTVNWRDYPATSWIGAEAVLAAPSAEEVPERSERLLAELRAALDAEFRIPEWSACCLDAGADAWFRTGENEYGGDSMLRSYNSPSWSGEAEIPRGQWDRVVEIVAEVASEHGLDARRDDDGGSPELKLWLREVSLSRGNDTEWLSVTVQDARRDPSGRALKDAEEHGWIVSGITMFYGITTISDEDRAEFERRAEPFAGLQRPPASHPS